MEDNNPLSDDKRIKAIQTELYGELKVAIAKHAPQHSFHESYAVILEELDEYWDQVKLWPKWHDPREMRKELLHTAAMAIRAILDHKLDEVGE